MNMLKVEVNNLFSNWLFTSFAIGLFLVLANVATAAPVISDTQTTDQTVATGPTINSSVFSDPDKWYNQLQGSFTWTVPKGVTAVALEFATSSDSEPQKVVKSPITKYVIEAGDLKDGVQYFQLQFKADKVWGDVYSRPIKIDTTAPVNLEIVLQTGTQASTFPVVLFGAEDSQSGIDHYELTVADRETIFMTPDEARFGYVLRELEDGDYNLEVAAYDQAGNQSTGFTTVKITAGWIDPTKIPPPGPFDWFLEISWLTWLLALLLTASLVQLVRLYRNKHLTEALLRHEAEEVKTQMEKIFTALRDEIHDQIATITKRSRLSKKEKEIVETLNQALEVSETLIGKEVSDVQNILK